mmetsp:Transcript_67644/g.162396  ORF Transcript_67644/g.162396 Transcript_67644/m.162396 type:complete len:202 (+) Transcript_67644:1749-2354(+)
MPRRLTTISFVSEIFLRFAPQVSSLFSALALAISRLAMVFSLLKDQSTHIRLKPKPKLIGSISCHFSASVLSKSKNPFVCGKTLKPNKFLHCCAIMISEPAVMKPLMVGCDRNLTAKARLNIPINTNVMPLNSASKLASCVRSSMSAQGRSWSAIKMAAMAPDEIDACGEVPKNAYAIGGMNAQYGPWAGFVVAMAACASV